MMKAFIRLFAIFLIALAMGNNSSMPSATRAAAAAATRSIQGKPGFSSVYTSLTKCGSGMTKAEEREAEKNGSDIPTKCKGPDGYYIYIYYSACASHFTAMKGEESIGLTMQTVNWKQKTVEWRLADGKPFAVIMRDYEYSGNDLCTTDGKIKRETLIVKGLKGYEQLDETIDVKTVPNPNVKARELADKGYK